MTEIIIKNDLRHNFGPVRDQGQRPTCLAFAASDLHASLREDWDPLSCEYIFFHAQKRAGRKPTDGAVLPNMLDAIREDGQPVETIWPYLKALPSDLNEWRPPAGRHELYRRASNPEQYSIDAVIEQLDMGVPVLMLMNVSHSFFYVAKDGIINGTPHEAVEYNRRHAVIAVAHGTVDSQRAVLVRNSWGSDWASHGYGWLTENYMKQRVFKLALLKEDLSVSANSAAA